VKSFLFFLLLAGIFSCTGSRTEIGKQLAGSDSLEINFNTPQTNNIAKTMTTTEKTAIQKIANYIDGKTAGAYKCDYDGNLVFYKKGIVVADVSFSYATTCRHFLLTLNGRLVSTSMSNEAADFLKGLSEGKDWY
jgi:hypothetical protein